ncbi:MAG TPA: flagellar M-ring protein FliF C-terminal domain-containing protein, partial [Burkholderiaceae bacterium]
DVDFSNVEQMDETYKPNQAADKAAVRSQSSTDSSQPGAAGAQGIPGALSNQPPVPPTAPISGQAAPLNPPAAAAAGASTHREQTTNFEVDKNVRHTRNASGEIRRLSAAVVINNKPAAGGQGAGTPWSAKEVENLQALVREAMGFNQQRGDSLNVVNAAFNQPEFASVEPVPLWQQPDALALAKEGGKALLFLLLTLIVVFGVVRPALKSIASAPRVIEAPAPAAIAPPPSTAGALTMSQIDQVRQIAKSDPATVANVVKAWVGDSKA